MIIKEGSKWSSIDGKVFHVIHVVELDGKTWVHYERDNINESQEYSCYVESFLQRFSKLPE